MTQKKRNYLNKQIDWIRTRDIFNPFETTIDGDKLVIHRNADGNKYTLMINDKEHISFDEWPDNWTQSPVDFVNLAIGKILEMQVKIDQHKEITMEDFDILRRLLQQVPRYDQEQQK